MKRSLTFLLCTAIALSGAAQTLFTFGANKVDKAEFLRAFNKNNQATDDKAKAIKEYLDLYIKFKLKVQAAKDMRMDTLANQKADLLNYETQLQETYMSGEAFMNELVAEAIERSKKDLEIAHLFISATGKDTTEARLTINKAYNDLKNGMSFEKAVSKYVSNNNYKIDNGRIGYITAFSLPYTLENIMYSLAVGEFSAPYKSKGGFHIFKVLSERPAVGSLQVAQILLAYPEGVTEEEKTQKRILADSIYYALLKGAAFNEMVKQFSEDKFTYQNNGEMQLVSLGKYDAKFENAAYGIEKEGGYSKPIETTTGVHIIKLLKKIPVNTDKENAEAIAGLQQQIRTSDRMIVAQNKQQEEILKQIRYKKIPFNEKEQWKIADSIMKLTEYKTYLKKVKKVPIASFAKQTLYNTEYLIFIRGRSTGDPRVLGPNYYTKEMEEFVKSSSQDYFKKHLAEYKPEYNYQVQEFKEGNLLFEIMEKNVWSKAGADTIGLKKYYAAHKEKYKWEPSVDAIIITCTDSAVEADAMKKIKAAPNSWKTFTTDFSGRVQADSGRFEMSQIPVVEKTNFEKGITTVPLKNDQDGTSVFAYIVKVYREPGQRNFEEAKGLVINDYQVVLEDKWITVLKKKYPVKVDEKVLGAILK
ncbi:MAG: peptidylprolyl isomerase [Sphingobacteriales bacterium]|nr:peptidylprolyl isomerase [Sphingobacteriales bacterium]MBI3717847.1 peptidylprolyl isomerase [Sphingobacteriales bacterium]